MLVLQIAKGCSPLSKGKQHLEYWRWFSKKKLGVKVYIQSLKFCQSMLLHCRCQHCCVPQVPHGIWLIQQPGSPCWWKNIIQSAIGYKIKRGNVPLWAVDGLGFSDLNNKAESTMTQKCCKGVAHEPLLHPALHCALVLHQASIQDLLCLNFLWKPTDKGKTNKKWK